MVAVHSELWLRLFPGFCTQPHEVAVLFNWNLSTRPTTKQKHSSRSLAINSAVRTFGGPLEQLSLATWGLSIEIATLLASILAFSNDLKEFRLYTVYNNCLFRNFGADETQKP